MKRKHNFPRATIVIALLMASVTYAYIFGPPSYKYDYGFINHPYAPITTDDFNGDGFPDIAWCDHCYDSCRILLGYGDGTFEPLDAFYVSIYPTEIVTGDFTSDGIIDLVILDVTGTDSVYVFEGLGDGSFQQINIFKPAEYFPDHMDVGDLNNDGFPDLVGPGWEPPLFIGNGDGTFQSPIILEFNPNGMMEGDAGTGDFDEDGNIDIVIACCAGMSSTNIRIYLNSGNLEFILSDSSYLEGWAS